MAIVPRLPRQSPGRESGLPAPNNSDDRYAVFACPTARRRSTWGPGGVVLLADLKKKLAPPESHDSSPRSRNTPPQEAPRNPGGRSRRLSPRCASLGRAKSRMFDRCRIVREGPFVKMPRTVPVLSRATPAGGQTRLFAALRVAPAATSPFRPNLKIPPAPQLPFWAK